MTRERRMFGLWDSPITAKSLAANLRLSDPHWDTDGSTLGWIEGRSDRGVLVVQREGDAPRDLTSDISVRAFVGYGGGDFTLSHGHAYFVGQVDQRIYRQPFSGRRAKAITPAFGAASTPVVSPDGRWLAYVHTYEDRDCIAVVDVEGKLWPARLAEGRDFYMQPAWSPDSRQIAWIEWDFPNMPWDGTELRLARLSFDGALPSIASSSTVAGGDEIAVFQPTFGSNDMLYYVSDESGWGHIYRYEISNANSQQLTVGEAEHATPAWQQGMRTFAVDPMGRVFAIRNDRGRNTLLEIDPGGTVEELTGDNYTDLSSPASGSGQTDFPLRRVALVASSTTTPPRVVVVEPDERISVRRYGSSEEAPAAALSVGRPYSWKSFDGEQAHGIYFPPASEHFEATGAPPLLVLVHGGPTSQVTLGWNAQAQYFATRGYAVLVPNYRGSTGYGREYMLKLRRNWGIYDVRDSKSGAEALAAEGLADPSRLVIMGGSAGGFTVLQSLVELPGTYKAGICMFGVANQFTLASDTHKFEQRYLDLMLGPLPEAASVYRERSPIFHADKIRDPIAVYQGDIDRVVPREQSDTIVASLRARGVPHEYTVYEGEGHGWRKTETIEAFYLSIERFLKQYVLYG